MRGHNKVTDQPGQSQTTLWLEPLFGRTSVMYSQMYIRSEICDQAVNCTILALLCGSVIDWLKSMPIRQYLTMTLCLGRVILGGAVAKAYLPYVIIIIYIYYYILLLYIIYYYILLIYNIYACTQTPSDDKHTL
eukprot:COSAG05_NODE_2050_length_3639_cov_2.035876_4_plen_134_part_00